MITPHLVHVTVSITSPVDRPCNIIFFPLQNLTFNHMLDESCVVCVYELLKSNRSQSLISNLFNNTDMLVLCLPSTVSPQCTSVACHFEAFDSLLTDVELIDSDLQVAIGNFNVRIRCSFVRVYISIIFPKFTKAFLSISMYIILFISFSPCPLFDIQTPRQIIYASLRKPKFGLASRARRLRNVYLFFFIRFISKIINKFKVAAFRSIQLHKTDEADRNV